MYKHLFFDWDKTLWDYDKNVKETLYYLYEYYHLEEIPQLNKTLFVSKYLENTNRLWELYDQNLITKEVVRNERFFKLIESEKFSSPTFITEINEHFLDLCPTKKSLIPHAEEVIAKLSENYDLHILTNGFLKTQNIKIQESGLADYFKLIITSECTAYKKPDKRIYEHALNLSKAKLSEVIMIGDSLKNDVLGAKDAGWEQIYFNPEHNALAEEVSISHQIHSLKELEPLFL